MTSKKHTAPGGDIPQADELLRFLNAILKGEALPEQCEESGKKFPTLEQRLKVALTLFGKMDAMTKKPANPENNAVIVSFSKEQIEEIRASMLGKLARIAGARPKRKMAKKAGSDGTGLPVS